MAQRASGSPLTAEDARHLLRRFAFAATPALERALRGQSAAAALDRLIADGRQAARPAPPACVRAPWTNSALRPAGMSDDRYDALRATQAAAARQDIDAVRQWWLAELIGGDAPMREQMTLFFEGTFGSSTAQLDIPHAIHGRNALIRRHALGSIPALLEALVLDPAMMIQTGMDEHFRVRVSDRAAKLVLDHWTVGAGNYGNADVEHLSRALTGWQLQPAPGFEPPVTPDPDAPRAARRMGLTPTFLPERADVRPKTLLGTTGTFDAPAAMFLLARHPATARRYAVRLLQHTGVESPSDALVARLAATYQATDGAIDALLRTIVAADEFWSEASRWALIKSPVHLLVGACRQLELEPAAPAVMTAWLQAAGQTLFDTPNGGEGGWPGQEAWITPPDRLGVRYQLPAVLAGREPALGVRRAEPATAAAALALPPALANATPAALLARLDPAPGLDVVATAGGGQRATRPDLVRRVLMSPQYQLA